MQRTRLAVAVGLLALLAGLAGCGSVFGPGQVDPSQLNANATYQWNTTADTSYNLTRSQYRVVIDLNASALEEAGRDENTTQLRLYVTDSIGTDRPVKVAALKFRYPNGTVVDASAFSVDKTRRRTIIVPPQDEGKIAYTAPRAPSKRFSVPVYMRGTHAITLPPGARVGIPLLSQVVPAPDQKTVTDNRMTVRWTDPVERGPLVVRYYLQRDLLVFGGMFAVLSLAGIGGALYYLRSIRKLKQRREEIGLDVETEDDDVDDGGPPPGMR